ncbi:MAG: bifunctional 2-C-methyl-D-erythritol 4-phosphate cytidylyltransferase/2-C-methyl-D-erythritol 2,4-cyclodiphosphate synthase [Pseudomonadota bacterium]
MTAAAVIVAAGASARAGEGIPKQFRRIAGAPAIRWSVQAFAAANISPIVAVIGAGQEDLLAEAIADGAAVLAVPGGATRTASVRAGLAALAQHAPDFVLVHDAARPGLNGEIIQELLATLADGADAVAPALPLSDALKRADGRGVVQSEEGRDNLFRVQTPQAFRYSAIRTAYARAPLESAFDDDLAIARAAGIAGRLIPGNQRLMKLTYPEDFAMAEAVLSGARVMCTGSGFDAHRFGPGDHVTLCGVKIAHDKALIGHSDADAGWHALVDAILGALGEGDIGVHFPPSDPKWAGADSEKFLRYAAERVAARGGRIAHVDVTLICERPKVSPHREAMRTRTAEVLALPLARVSVKATTTERLGFLGREEGLAAQALASVELPD